MMPNALRGNAVIVFGLAALLCWSFMFAKHDPGLRSVIPFGEDPYDAVGSFGTIVGMLVAPVSLGRAFRPYHEAPPSTAQRVYLVRSQAAVVLVVLMTLAADTVAMARHPSMWIRTASRNGLMAPLGSLAVVAVAVHLLIRPSQHELPETGPNRWKRPGSPVYSPYWSSCFIRSN
jgi:predicted Na+-dependent transporter